MPEPTDSYGNTTQLAPQASVAPNPHAPGMAGILYFEPVSHPRQDPNGSGTIRRYLMILRQRGGMLLGMAFLGAAVGFLVTFSVTPIFQARATLMIQGSNENAMSVKDGGPARELSMPDIPTQIRILSSRSLMVKAVEEYRKRESELTREVSRPLLSWRRWLRLGEPTRPELKEHALRMASATLTVRSVPATQVIELSSQSSHPEVAALFLNTVIQQFVKQNFDSRAQFVHATGGWLAGQLEDLKTKVRGSEQQLHQFSLSAGMILASPEQDVGHEKLRQLLQELSKAQADRIEKQSTYETALSSAAESVPKILDDTRLRDLQAKAADLRREAAELGSALRPEHYRIRRLNAQIAVLESTLSRERANILSRLRNDYNAALRREKLLSSEATREAAHVLAESNKANQYSLLQREVEANRQLYDSVLQKVKEVGILSAMPLSNIQPLDPAQPPSKPYKPSLPANVALGMLGGLLVGGVGLLLKDALDESLKSPSEAVSYLSLHELGVIPEASLEIIVGAGRGKQIRGADPQENGNQALATWQSKCSLLAECYRDTLASVLHSGKQNQVIVLTSAAPREGKTTVTCNLGIALAEINRKVVLIDGDMRRPKLHTVFGLANSWGLSDLLSDRNSIEDYPIEAIVRPTNVPNLHIVPSGPGPGSISSLLYSGQMRRLVDRLRQEFDLVLIDTPPIIQLADTRILAQVADAAVLIVRAGQTNREAALSAKQRLETDHIPVLGIIMVCWNPRYSRYSPYDYRYLRYSTDI